jgi:hypothetical protein
MILHLVMLLIIYIFYTQATTKKGNSQGLIFLEEYMIIKFDHILLIIPDPFELACKISHYYN